MRVRPSRRRATRIAFWLPVFTKKGKPIMSNFELTNDTVATITIKTTNSVGTVEPYPTGDAFTAASSKPASLAATIGTDAAGNPALVLTPLVQASPGITVTVSDSAKLSPVSLVVDVVQDVADTNIILDVADASNASQPTPVNPGP